MCAHNIFFVEKYQHFSDEKSALSVAMFSHVLAHFYSMGQNGGGGGGIHR